MSLKQSRTFGIVIAQKKRGNAILLKSSIEKACKNLVTTYIDSDIRVAKINSLKIFAEQFYVVKAVSFGNIPRINLERAGCQ